MFLARAALAVPNDLLAIIQVVPQEIDVLKVNDFDGVAAEIARAPAAWTSSARPSPARRAVSTTASTTTTETTAATSAAAATETTAATSAAATTTTEPSRRPAL